MIDHPSPQAPVSQLNAHQNALASRVFAEAIGELAKKCYCDEAMEANAVSLAKSLKAGLLEINRSGSCNKPSVPCEQQ